MQIVQSFVLGALEGLTEFIPVSSTGHLLLAAHFLGFDGGNGVFEVLIQLGAILAVIGAYAVRLAQMVRGMVARDEREWRFFTSVVIAFLPAAFAGFLLHDYIKAVLFASPRLIAWSLIIGGVVLLVVDRLPLTVRYAESDRLPFRVTLGIGLAQCLALIPGVSRSGSTIVGALLMGVDRRSAAEFSFFLSVPTMLAAFALDFWKSRQLIDGSMAGDIAIGFVTAFVVAILVVRWFLGYITRHGFALFGWWRIGVGALALLALAAGY